MYNLNSYPLEENYLIHSAVEGRLYIVNPTGHFILEHLRVGRSIPDVARQMVRQYGIRLETALEDTETAVNEWRQIGLLPGEGLDSRRIEVPAELAWHQSRAVHIKRYYQLPGLCFSVKFNRESMEQQCHPRLSAIEIPASDEVDVAMEIKSDGAMWVVVLNNREILRTVYLNEARIELLISILTSYHKKLEIMAMIHAGVVALGEKVLVLPATTQGGKSTLTAALVHAGYNYLSDDIAPIDGPSGRVYPFPLGLSLRPGSWPLVERMFPDLRNRQPLSGPYEEVKVVPVPGRRTEFKPLCVSALIFPAYGPEKRNNLQVLSLTQAMVNLSEAGFWVPLQGGQVLRFLEWVREIPCYQMEYSNLEAAVKLVAGLTP